MSVELLAAAAAIVLVFLAVAGVVGYVVYYYVLRGVLVPVRKTRASVVRKHQREWLGTLDFAADALDDSPGLSDIENYEHHDFFVVFLVNGREMEFSVSEQTYLDIREGDEGVLCHKGNLFRYFLPLRSPSRGLQTRS